MNPIVDDPDVSIVVPLYNEGENVGRLVDWLFDVADGHSWSAEVILVDDGSTDDTWSRMREYTRPGLVGIRLAANRGQTAAMMAGFDRARGRVVVSLDGDLQNDPRDIPMLIAKLDEGYDLVAGWRRKRRDKLLVRKIPSWFANRLIRRLTGVPIRDNGCSLKAYRRDLLRGLNLYSDQHRFIPALAAANGARITEVPVRHHPRRFGQSKYGLSRVFKVLADVVALKMITTFRARPLVGFSVGAAAALALALVATVLSVVAVTSFSAAKAEALVLPAIAVIWLSAAFYLIMLGLIGEVALRHEGTRSGSAPLYREISE